MVLWNILTHLDRARVDPSLALLEPGPLVEAARAIGIAVEAHPAGRMRQLGSAAATVRFLARLIDDQRPDILVNWHAKGHLYGAAARTRARHRPRAVWWQHMIPDGHWLDRVATLLPTDAVGASSHAIATAQARCRPRRRTFVVHPGTPDPGPQGVSQRPAQRAALSIPSRQHVIAIVGRLQKWKGQDRFIHALALLRDQGLDVHGVVIGGAAFGLSTQYAESLPRLADELDLAGQITFTGQIDDVTPYLRCADVLVNASDDEPFGNVLIEGMSYGVPVVAVASGGPLEIISDGTSGILARTGRPHDLADAIARLVRDDELKLRIGQAGRHRFLEAFTAKRMADELTVELEGLASNGRA